MGLTFDQVRAARERQAPFVRRTPTEPSPDLSEMVGRQAFLKLENLSSAPVPSSCAAPSLGY